MQALRCTPSTSLGNDSPGALVFQYDMFLNLPLITDIVTLDKHRLTPDSLRLIHAGLSTTTPSATKFIMAILTATSWRPFALVPRRSFVSIPTTPIPCNADRPMNAFPFVILLHFARLKIPLCGRMNTHICNLCPSGSI